MSIRVDGHEIEYRIFRPNAFTEGGAVLMAHGAAMDHSIWGPVLPSLDALLNEYGSEIR